MGINHIVFYGTLMSNGNTPLYKRMKEDLVYKGACIFRGNLYDLGRYPGLKEGEGDIQGELYEIKDSSMLPILDEYEAYDNYDSSLPGFIRKPINLVEPKLRAWIYFYEGDVATKTPLETTHWIPPI